MEDIFGWTGRARQSEFRWFSGVGVKAAKTAMEPLKLAPRKEGKG